VLFPRFNEEERAVAGHLDAAEQEALAAMLRSLLRAVAPEVAAGDGDASPVV
jgi:hypothetical protein